MATNIGFENVFENISILLLYEIKINAKGMIFNRYICEGKIDDLFVLEAPKMRNLFTNVNDIAKLVLKYFAFLFLAISGKELLIIAPLVLILFIIRDF